MPFPIKAIYSSDGKNVTGLGEFTSSDTIDIAALPTGDKDTQVARGDHTHKGYAATSHTHTEYQDTITATGLLKGTGSGAISAATAGTDYAAPDHTHSGYQSIINASGLLKGAGSGAISAATPGTDFVSKDSATNFTKPQKPSFNAVSLTSVNPSYLWDLSIHQTIHLSIAAGVTATLSLTTAPTDTLLGLSYRLIISGAATSLTLPSIKWASSTAPTLTNSASKADILTFEVMSLGSSYVLVEVGRNLSVG